jgi:general stress protein 26
MSDRFWEIVDGIGFPLFVTNGKDGFPRARPMSLLLRVGRTVWFATSRTSNKVSEIADDPRVTVLFIDTVLFNYAYLHGRARLITDSEEKRKLWQKAWTDDWPEGPSDLDYVLIEVVGECGTYYYGDRDEGGDVTLFLH